MGDVPAAAAASSPAGKRRRGGDDGLRRVAEIVMVLAAAGEVRGGREPTAAERALAAEARERLAAAVAQGAVRPKDLFPGEAVRAVVEDLGLNRAKDPAAMGFRPPKASIADRLMLTKRKMEEVKEPPVQPINTPQTIVSSGMSEFQGSHGASKYGVGVPSHPRNPPSTAPLNSASLVSFKPPGSSPVIQVTNSGVAAPHTGSAHLKLEKDVSGAQSVARSGANIVHSTKPTSNTSAGHNVTVVQSSNQVKNQDTKTVAIQAVTGNPVTGLRAAPGVAYVPPKNPFIHHNDIAKSVQQFLHQPMNHPSWIPPSAEYMHSRLCCQICKLVISDVDSLLVCDACERGAHLICLQNYGNKGVPKAEWHCSVCLTQSKGKPLPPKYGKVTRTAVASKAPPPANGAQFSLQGSAETKPIKENQQNLAPNGNPTRPISTHAGNTIQNSNVLALSAPTAGLQSQLVCTLRPSVGNTVKSEASSNEKEGTEQPCSSIVPDSMNSPPSKRLRSDSSLNSADSANDIMQHRKSEEVSGVKYVDNSLSSGATSFKSEPHSKPVLSRDVEMVDHSGTQMEQASTVSAEEKPKTQATNFKLEAHSKPLLNRNEEMIGHSGTQMEQASTVSIEEKPKTQATTINLEEVKHVGDTTYTGKSTTDQGTNSATEEKHQSQATSVPHTICDVEMASPTGSGKPICQSSNDSIDEKFKTDATSEPPIDQGNNLANEENPSEQTSVPDDGGTGIPSNESDHANGLNGNELKESPSRDKNKSDYNVASDHGNIQTVALNGVLHPKDEMSCVSENEAVGDSDSTEAKEQAK